MKKNDRIFIVAQQFYGNRTGKGARNSRISLQIGVGYANYQPLTVKSQG